MIKRQFTVTCYLIQDAKVLLLHHRKYRKWVPPGGHLEENETPSEGVMREVLEETGLLIELEKGEELWIEEKKCMSLPRPYLCLLEKIPVYGKEPEHEHIDLIYVGHPIGGQMVESNESEQMRWFTLEEVLSLKPEEEIFLDVQKTVEHLLHRKENRLRVELTQAASRATGA